MLINMPALCMWATLPPAPAARQLFSYQDFIKDLLQSLDQQEGGGQIVDYHFA